MKHRASAPAPAAAMDPTWGTRRRIEAHLSHVDKGGLDQLLDKVLRMGSAPPFIAKFHPQPGWLWRQWRGTVLQQCWVPACAMMAVSALLVFVMEPVRLQGDHKWTLFEVPSPDDAVVARLRGFTTMWGYLLTMATFVNSFFLSQACSRMVRPRRPWQQPGPAAGSGRPHAGATAIWAAEEQRRGHSGPTVPPCRLSEAPPAPPTPLRVPLPPSQVRLLARHQGQRAQGAGKAE